MWRILSLPFLFMLTASAAAPKADRMDIMDLWARHASQINGALMVGLLGLVLTNRLNNRKLTLEDNKGLRAEFIAEMHALREDVKSLRIENDSLRQEVRGLHGVIDGLRRLNMSGQIAALRIAGEAVPPEIVEMMARLDAIPGKTS